RRVEGGRLVRLLAESRGSPSPAVGAGNVLAQQIVQDAQLILLDGVGPHELESPRWVCRCDVPCRGIGRQPQDELSALDGEAGASQCVDSCLVGLVGRRVHPAGRQIVVRLPDHEAPPVGPCELLHPLTPPLRRTLGTYSYTRWTGVPLGRLRSH